MVSGFDIIGDIHGHFDHLEALLRKLGYLESGNVWGHRSRQAIFVGDLIDRGPKQVETVQAVRRMVDGGLAQCIQGNHEFNAVAWHTPDPENPGEYLRPHAGKAGDNRRQHAEFLRQVGEGSALHSRFVAWFRTLPLWLDLGEIRVVHACWHVPSLNWLTSRVAPGNTLTESLYMDGSRFDHPAFRSIEAVCKGLEVSLPDGVSFRDKDGRERRAVRVAWWKREFPNYRDAVVGPPSLIESIPNVPFPRDLQPEPYMGPPVFFGHYWFRGVPKVLGSKLACLDYSVASGGPLVAYRWDGESTLDSKRLVQVS